MVNFMLSLYLFHRLYCCCMLIYYENLHTKTFIVCTISKSTFFSDILHFYDIMHLLFVSSLLKHSEIKVGEMNCDTVGLFKCIVSDLFFYNNQKSATSVFVIPTSVLVISCVTNTKAIKESIICDQKEWVGRRYNGIFDRSEMCWNAVSPTVNKVWLAPSSRSFWVIPTRK